MTSVIFWCCVGIAITATTLAVVVALLLVMYCRQRQNLENWTVRFSHPSKDGWVYRTIQNLCLCGQSKQERITDE